MLRALMTILSFALVTAAHAQPAGYEDAMRQAEEAQKRYGAGSAATGAAMQPQKLPPPVALTSDEVSRFIAASKSLDEIGFRVESDPAKSHAGKDVQAMAASSEALGVIQSNGFTPERFQQVAFSIGMAMAGLDMKSQGVDAAAATAEQERAMAEMKAQMPPAQYEMMRKQMTGASAMLSHIQAQPPANLELIESRRGEIEAALKDR